MLDKKLYKNLKALGKILPETESEILEFEDVYRKVVFPDVSDINPSDIIGTEITLESASITNGYDTNSDSVSMAARNGMEISKELLDQMHVDRANVRKDDNRE